MPQVASQAKYTQADLYYPGSAEFLGDPLPDYIRCFPTAGNVEVVMPDASDPLYLGQRVTIANFGTSPRVVHLNAEVAGQTIDGGTGTYNVNAGSRIEFQGIDRGGGNYGWEIVSSL